MSEKKKPWGKPFAGPGDPRLRQNIEAVGGLTSWLPGAPAVGGVPSTLYEDMLHVKNRPHTEDVTPGQKDCRAWKRKNPGAFFNRMAELEKAALSRQPAISPSDSPSSPQATATLDAGTERARGLLREQIAQGRAKQAQEDAELARQPNAAGLGRQRQEELRAALWRERQVLDRLTELEAGRAGEDDVFWRALREEFYGGLRVEAAELALRPDPQAVVGSLLRATKWTQEHAQQFQARVRELEA